MAKYMMPYGTPATAAACSAEHRRVIAKALKLEGATWNKMPSLPVPKYDGAFRKMLLAHVEKQMGKTELWGD